MPNRVYFGNNLPVLQSLPDSSIDLIYIDPPFNTGKTQARTQIRAERSENGDRTGFGAGGVYETVKIAPKGTPISLTTTCPSSNPGWMKPPPAQTIGQPVLSH
jgi:hypothetical protein